MDLGTPVAVSSSAGAAAGPAGRSGAPRWARLALLVLLAGTAVLYLWGLSASGWANAFYSAAAQAGSQSWHAFFYAASDPAASITVDKTPASVWVMAMSVRLFGLSPWSVLAPQALMGVATVALVYATVRRTSGHAAGLLAGLATALTPVAVLMFRFNNPDALLVLALTGAGYATVRALEKAGGRWLALAGVLVGLGFLTKMLQAFLVVPAIAVVYLLAAPTTLRRRLLHGLGAVGAMLLSAGWWVAVVELVPASARPWIGGSQHNSVLELMLGYNGLGRLNGDETGSVGGGLGWGNHGLDRMFSQSVGGQVSWLLPAALLLLVGGILLRGRRPRTDLPRAAYLLWGGWLVLTAVVFSLMAGIFHEYYTVALAPAIAALVGMGAVDAWRRRGDWAGSALLAGAAGLTAVWAFVLLGRTSVYPDSLRGTVLLVGLGAALLLAAGPWLDRRVVAVAAALAVGMALTGPTAWSLATAGRTHAGSIVTAGPTGGFGQRPGATLALPNGSPAMTRPMGGSMGGRVRNVGPGGTLPQLGTTPPLGGTGTLLEAGTPGADLVAALRENASSYTWAAAAIGSQRAAGLQLASGESVMPVGGFNGSDPSPSLARFQQLVAEGRVHWFVRGAVGMGSGGSRSSTQIAEWVSQHFPKVSVDGTTLYDLTQPLAGTS